MNSPIVKRSLVVSGHKTSVSLEDVFWNGLKEIATVRHLPISDLVSQIDGSRRGNLSSAIRVYVFDYFDVRASASGSRSHPDTLPTSVHQLGPRAAAS